MAIRTHSASTLLLALLCGCAGLVQGQSSTETCYSLTGELSDTLYVRERLSDASPPVPRLAHLGPYPPSADGEYRVRFRDENYLAWGMPARVTTASTSEYALIRAGSADRIPIFVRANGFSSGEPVPPMIWAPITEDCVFLPYRRDSEIR
jgi:hypothetical protein